MRQAQARLKAGAEPLSLGATMSANGHTRGEVTGSALTVLLTVMFVNMIGFGIIVPLLPFYAESFHAASWQV